MSNSTVQILARVLRVLLIFAYAQRPGSAAGSRLRHGQRGNLFWRRRHFLHDLFHPEADDVTAAGVSAIFLSWVWIWGEGANALIACSW